MISQKEVESEIKADLCRKIVEHRRLSKLSIDDFCLQVGLSLVDFLKIKGQRIDLFTVDELYVIILKSEKLQQSEH